MSDTQKITTAPIAEDDATLREALKEAHLPSLLASLVHLTGDLGQLDLEQPLTFDFFGDGQGGLPEAEQARIRDVAFEALRALRDGQGRLPAAPSSETICKMMEFVAGQPIPGRYVPFLMEELALEQHDTKARSWCEGVSADDKRGFHVLVVGAGMSGMLAAIRLEQAGIPYVVVDKNEDVGGTWWENTYPGCRVDTPNHLYSYSFEPKHDWPQHYSTQDVLFDYFRSCSEKYGVRENIRFSTEVEEATFDEADGSWRVRLRTADGGAETLEVRAIITAVGQLNRPRLPDIPGRDRFAGPSFHSGRWEHDVDLRGKRVAVVGTGASSFQFVPLIAEQTSEVLLFQRSAPWLAPTPNYHDDVTPGMQWLLRHVPFYEKWYRFWLFWMLTDGILPMVTADDDWQGPDNAVGAANDLLRQALTGYIQSQLADHPELAEAAVPTYPPGGKRMLRDNGVWLDALKRDDLQLLTSDIREITESGLVTADGTTHEVDVIIYGTGFTASEFLAPMKIVGRDGVTLDERWSGDARAYLGITIPGFPNLFCMYGPNTNIVVNGSIIFFSECEVRYILGCIELLLSKDLRSLECKESVHDAFNAEIDSANAKMAWGAPQVSSWYKNAKGRVSQNWPLALVDYWERTLGPNVDDYELR